jgi:hypothetical protein
VLERRSPGNLPLQLVEMRVGEVLVPLQATDNDPRRCVCRLAKARTSAALKLLMAERDVRPIEELVIHSGKVVGVEYMRGVVERYSPFRPARPGGTRFVRKGPG